MKNNEKSTHMRMRFHNLTGILLFAVLSISTNATAQQVSGPIAPFDTVAKNSALPSTLIKYAHLQNYLQPEWGQGAIVSPLLPIARTEGLDDHERFFLGQLNFMAFEGQAAYDIFGEFTERDDWYGWMARARQTIIDARFFGNFERLEQKVRYERENFEFRPEFADMPGFGERSLCSQWAKTGEHERAAELAVSTIAATPRDAPYGTLTLVVGCYQSFEQTGRKGEAFELAQEIKNSLEATLTRRERTQGDYPPYDEMLFENIVDNRWYHRSVQAPYNYQSHNIEKMIANLENFLLCRRDNIAESCANQQF